MILFLWDWLEEMSGVMEMTICKHLCSIFSGSNICSLQFLHSCIAVSPVEYVAFLAEPCNMVYSLFYISPYYGLLKTTCWTSISIGKIGILTQEILVFW